MKYTAEQVEEAVRRAQESGAVGEALAAAVAAELARQATEGGHAPKAAKRKLSARGEEAAARFLSRNGYRILERNWSCPAGEADIVALHDEANTLAFVEVKTRRGTESGLPSEAATRAKRERFERIALDYVQGHFFGDASVRFDSVSIVVMDGDRAFVRHHLGAYSAAA